MSLSQQMPAGIAQWQRHMSSDLYRYVNVMIKYANSKPKVSNVRFTHVTLALTDLKSVGFHIPKLKHCIFSRAVFGTLSAILRSHPFSSANALPWWWPMFWSIRNRGNLGPPTLVVEERVKPGELKAGFKNQRPSFLGLGLQKSGQVSKSQQNWFFLVRWFKSNRMASCGSIEKN